MTTTARINKTIKKTIKKATAIDKVKAIEAESAAHLFERDDMIHTLALAIIAKVNTLCLGVPGTAKTMTVRTVSESFCDAPGDFFDLLMAKTTKPDELFGPVDIKALTDNGEQRRNIDGYAPTAKVCVFDEMWKGSTAILNTLLTLSNERKFRNGSDGWVDCPLRFAVGMSNEFPEDPTMLAALFDRFPIKLMVPPIQDDNNFKAMISNGMPGVTTKLDDSDLEELDALVKACDVPAHILDSIVGIRADLAAKGVEISDRRWFQAVKVMKAAAVYAGRDKVADADLSVLEWIAWNKDGEQAIIKSILPIYAAPIEREVRALLEEVYEERAKVLKAWNEDGADSSRPTCDAAAAASAGIHAFATVNSVNDAIMALVTEADGDAAARVDEAIDEVTEIGARIRAVSLGTRDAAAKAKAVAALKATE